MQKLNNGPVLGPFFKCARNADSLGSKRADDQNRAEPVLLQKIGPKLSRCGLFGPAAPTRPKRSKVIETLHV